MRRIPELDGFEESLFVAGERVPPGTYRQLGGRREVHLAEEDILPASLDGQVAVYRRVHSTWSQREQDQAA